MKGEIIERLYAQRYFNKFSLSEYRMLVETGLQMMDQQFMPDSNQAQIYTIAMEYQQELYLALLGADNIETFETESCFPTSFRFVLTDETARINQA